jgi:tetratricopeptide (TPR) repeat protein
MDDTVDPRELERLCRQVEAGEPLVSGDLEALAEAARELPSLRVTLAHALIDGGELRAALELARALRRDQPGDAQTSLLLARALAATERYGEAEGALQEALRLRPQDPEALKALALLALRRGERGRAAQLIDQVLALDPLDGEAQLVRAELDAVGGETASLAADCEAPARPLDRAALLARVLPVLRPASFIARAGGACRRPGPAGLWVFHVLEDPVLLRYVPHGALEGLDLSLDAVDDAAFANLQPAEPVPGTHPGVWGLRSGDGHDAARLLLPAQRALLEAKLGPPPWRAFLGQREWVVLCAEEDASARAWLEGLVPSLLGIQGTFPVTRDGL